MYVIATLFLRHDTGMLKGSLEIMIFTNLYLTVNIQYPNQYLLFSEL